MNQMRAEALIRRPWLGKVVLAKAYDTNDIVQAVLQADKLAAADTARLAPDFRRDTPRATAAAIWEFIRKYIPYFIDPPERQHVKLPGELWASRSGDCKSYSVFAASILKNLGIPYVYRFVGFSPNAKVVTHVYVVLKHKGREYPIDACLPVQSEKPYQHKVDHMPELAIIGSAGRASTHDGMPPLGLPEDRDVTVGEMELLIQRQAYALDRDMMRAALGIGNVRSERYQDGIDVMDDALGAVHRFCHGGDHACIGSLENELGMIADAADEGHYRTAAMLSGIGSAADRLRVRENCRRQRTLMFRNWQGIGAPKKKKKKRSGISRFFGRVGKGVRKGVKAITKAVTFLPRLAIKGLLELTLPKASSWFLYLFINNKATLEKLPANIKRKRQKQQKVADFIVKKIGMKRSHFMGIIRNGIKRSFGKTPEAVLAQRLKIDQSTINGYLYPSVGIAPLLLAATAFSGGETDTAKNKDGTAEAATKKGGLGAFIEKAFQFVLQLLQKLGGFGGGEKPTAQDGPGDGDFGAVTQEVAQDIRQERITPETSAGAPLSYTAPDELAGEAQDLFRRNEEMIARDNEFMPPEAAELDRTDPPPPQTAPGQSVAKVWC